MKDNKFLKIMLEKLEHTQKMIEIEKSISASSELEDEVFLKIPGFKKQIKEHLSSDIYTNQEDYKLYMTCKRLISYWNS